MLQRYRLNAIRHTLSVLCLAMLFACSSSKTDESDFPSVGHREQHLGDVGRLTPDEHTTYILNQKYIQSLARPDVPIQLNLADERQYQFVLTRLELVGKTAETAPYLFDLLAQRRKNHISWGYGTGLLPNATYTAQADPLRRELHYLERTSAGETTGEAKGTASSTTPNGAYYTYVDVDYRSASGVLLGSPAMVEEYDGGTNTTITTTANLSLTNLRSYTVSSYKVEDGARGFIDSYLYTTIGTNGSQVSAPPRLSPPAVDAPLDIRLNDNIISVCLNRTWTQDCDYDLTGTPEAIKLPLKGSIQIQTAEHTFDVARINQIKTELNNNCETNDNCTIAPAGDISLVLTNVGGGCNVTNGNTLVASMAQFWNRVTVSVDRKTFSWDLTGANSAFFDDGCRQVQNFAKLTMRIVLYMLDNAPPPGPNSYRSSITLSNDPAVLRPDFSYKPITITNSCLSEGSQIRVANGKTIPVEFLDVGVQVFNPFDTVSHALTVTDTAIGFEDMPMVRIRDEAGRTLLMTEMHPIQTRDGGMVQARALSKGDVVMTETGPSRLVEVSREDYDGRVFNLKLGSESEIASLATDQTVLYANGFLVGDGQIQSKYEILAMTQKHGNIFDRLPKQWHRDYLQSEQNR